jgi:hypothetical protein
VTSLDLSAVFDIVNTNLLIKRLKIVGLPDDVIDLIKVWLKERSYNVSIDGVNSVLFDLLLGTLQGSILGPVLYAIFVSPMFDIDFFLSFVDDTFIPKTTICKRTLIEDMEKSLESLTKWWKKSGLKVNSNKTKLCLFYKNDIAPITITLDGVPIKSANNIYVFGLLFDAKLSWTPHIYNTIAKASKSLNTLNLIRKIFNMKEFLTLLTSNNYQYFITFLKFGL